MKVYLVEYQPEAQSRWVGVGSFKARNSRAAIAQFVNTYRGDVYSVRAIG